MPKPAITIAVATALVLCGCADKLLSDDSIRTSTATVLNQPADSIRIGNRRYDGATNTSYTATTPRGTYHCTINGGTVMAFGMTNPPVCSRAS